MTREPTEMELRCAKADFEQAVRGYKAQTKLAEGYQHDAWDKQTPELQAEWVNIVRAIKAELRKFSTSDEWEMLIDAASPPE